MSDRVLNLSEYGGLCLDVGNQKHYLCSHILNNEENEL